MGACARAEELVLPDSLIGAPANALQTKLQKGAGLAVGFAAVCSALQAHARTKRHVHECSIQKELTGNCLTGKALRSYSTSPLVNKQQYGLRSLQTHTLSLKSDDK